jgi:hypothetical protein
MKGERWSLGALVVLAACWNCPPPAFVGIPDACKRFDAELPLAAAAREDAIDFLQLGNDPPRQFRREDTAARQAAIARYGELLAQLAQQPVRAEDLAAGGRIGKLADDPSLAIAVHDARAAELGTADARALVVGGYVFAFYRAHDPATVDHPATPWEFALGGDTFASVTICPRNAWRS